MEMRNNYNIENRIKGIRNRIKSNISIIQRKKPSLSLFELSEEKIFSLNKAYNSAVKLLIKERLLKEERLSNATNKEPIVLLNSVEGIMYNIERWDDEKIKRNVESLESLCNYIEKTLRD